MLDTATSTTGNADSSADEDDTQKVLAFQDMRGQVWQLVRRDDLKSLEEIVDVNDSADAQ